MAMESIAVDRNLREVFNRELAKYLARTGEVPVGDGNVLSSQKR